MILQALVDCYEALSASEKIARPGWGPVKASVALELTETGEIFQAIFLKEEVEKGKKKVLVPKIFDLPAPVKRTVGVAANFLCDNSSYILGFDEKGKPKRSLECFAACKALHEKILDGVESPAAKAVSAFFENWEPEKAREHPALQDYMDELLAGGNLVFRYDGQFVHEDPAIRQAWQEYYDQSGDGPEMVCLVTGKTGPVENIHPSVKGVQGAQSSGAALVSFNAPAFCSYGKEQNLNAPTSKYAAFAYTSALNYLIASPEYGSRVGDTTVLFWAKNGSPEYSELAMWGIFGGPAPYTERELQSMVQNLCKGRAVTYEETLLDPDMDFYILGLAPNAARLSVRFFLHNQFGSILQNVQAHYDRLEIVKPPFEKFEALPVWKLLSETVNQNSREKEPLPALAGETLRAILNNTRYPATLLNGVTMRIRAERKITWGRAAILKAYYLQNTHPDVPKEVLTVSLNPESKNPYYTLGRLFSVLEAVQSAANPGINATIKDRYFNSASATPSIVFPTLLNLSEKHRKKLAAGQRIYYEKQIMELLAVLGESFPTRLSLPQQGTFQLGYYHQTQERYQKKEEN
mgnify:FL=1